MRPSLGLILCLLLSSVSVAQVDADAQAAKLPERLDTPVVHPDGSVTFQFLAPHALEVKLEREGADPVSMSKDSAGIWTVTTPPLPPDYYGYSILVDGVRMIDPFNSLLKPNLLETENAVHVPGPHSLPWEVNDVPRGEVHHHFYRSAVAGDDRDYYVYTPAGYDERSQQVYPVLYLLHGFSDDAGGWTAVGYANVILDNLIASGKARPMIVVMPLGYGTIEVLRQGWHSWDQAELRDRNFRKFREALLTEVMPQVENEYRISKDREGRAIAGLSMGGSESLLTGLNNLDKFAWVGAFSSGGLSDDFQTDFPGLAAKANDRANDHANDHTNDQLRLLWIACGTEDPLIALNRKLRAWLASKGVRHTDIETPGVHTWMVWRRNLAEFATLLFR